MAIEVSRPPERPQQPCPFKAGKFVGGRGTTCPQGDGSYTHFHYHTTDTGNGLDSCLYATSDQWGSEKGTLLR